MRRDLEKKIDQARRLIDAAGKRAAGMGQELEIAYSGGKDSEVILELAKMSSAKFVPIYKNTTIDPPGTIAHVRTKGAQVLAPKKTFRELIETKGYPSRWRRFCCEKLKEYPVPDNAVLGIRRAESRARSERYLEPEVCRVWNKTKNISTRQYLPILEWTEEDERDSIELRGVRCHSLYYDARGNFHPERRLGCMCCPLQSRQKRLESFTRYPAMVRYYINAGQRYLETHQDGKLSQMFQGNVYEWFISMAFYDGKRQFDDASGNRIFVDQNQDPKKMLEEYFHVSL